MRDVILKALENRDFVEKILGYMNEDQVKQAFNEIGIDITDDEIMELAKYLGRVYDRIRNTPLDDIEEIAAGNSLTNLTEGYMDYMREGVSDPVNKRIFGENPSKDNLAQKVGRKTVEIASYVVPASLFVTLFKRAAKGVTSWFQRKGSK